MRSEWFQVLSGVRQGCIVAPHLFLNPLDWISDWTVEQSPLGVSVGEESFTDLGYALDDVVLLAEMLETLVTGQEEAAPIGLQINWTKRKSSMSGNHV